jgi:hypothetical protein
LSEGALAGSRRIRVAVLLTALYAALALAFTWPLAAHFTTNHVGESGGDARVYVWNLWWVKTALVERHVSPFETDMIFHPVGIGLALHTLGLWQGLLFLPLDALFGFVAGANLVVLFSFVASALGAFALARREGASREGAFLAGLVFAFCPYRLARLAGHYDLLATEWIPVYLLALLAALTPGRARPLALVGCGLAAAGCGYANLSYLAFLGLFSAAYVGVKLVCDRRRVEVLARAVAIAAVAFVALLPLLLAARRDLTSWGYVPYPGGDRYGADLARWVRPSPEQTLLGGVIGQALDRNIAETTVFPGYLALALGLGALAAPAIRRSHALWAATGAVAFVLSLGRGLRVGGRALDVPLPFALLERVPLLDNLRAPSRFSLLTMLALGLLLAALWTRWAARLRPGPRVLATAALAALIAAEYLAVPIPLFASGAPAVYSRIAAEPGDFAVAEVPGIEQVAGRIMYNQTIHGKRIFLGFAARVPPEKTAYFMGLPLVRPLVEVRKGRLAVTPALLEQERDTAREAARFLGLRYVVVEQAFAPRGVLAFLEGVLPVERAHEDAVLVALRVDESRLPADPWAVAADAPASRMHFEHGWARPESEGVAAFRRATDTRSTLLFRRPAPEALELCARLTASQGGHRVEARLGGLSLGVRAVGETWAEVRWTLPPAADGNVERLELMWAGDWAEGSGPRLAGFRFQRTR